MKKTFLSLAVVALAAFGTQAFAQDQDKDKKKDSRQEQPADVNKEEQKKEEDQKMSNEQAPATEQKENFDPNQPKTDMQQTDSSSPATPPVQEPVK